MEDDEKEHGSESDHSSGCGYGSESDHESGCDCGLSAARTFRRNQLQSVMAAICGVPTVHPDDNGDITLAAALSAAGAPPVGKWGIETFTASSTMVGSDHVATVPRPHPILDRIECTSGNASNVKILVGNKVVGIGLPWNQPLPLSALAYQEIQLVSTDGPFAVNLRFRYCGCGITRYTTMTLCDKTTCIPQVEVVKRIMAQCGPFYAFDGPYGPFKTQSGLLVSGFENQLQYITLDQQVIP